MAALRQASETNFARINRNALMVESSSPFPYTPPLPTYQREGLLGAELERGFLAALL